MGTPEAEDEEPDDPQFHAAEEDARGNQEDDDSEKDAVAQGGASECADPFRELHRTSGRGADHRI